jgi:signal transduction histidine kinase
MRILRSLRARLTLSHVLPLLVVIPLVGIALTYLLETQVILASQSQELERQAVLVATVTADYPGIWLDARLAQSFTSRIGDSLTARVMLLDAEQRLLASTDASDQGLLGQQLDVPGFEEVQARGQVARVDYGEQPGTGAADVLVPVYINQIFVGVIRLTDPLSSVYERFPRTRVLISGVLVGGLVLGLGIGWFLAIDLERPLRRAADAISQMAAGQRLAELPEQGPEEVRLVLRAFNALSARLQSLERARQRLLANLVHELGRPLGALRSALQALTAGAVEDPALREELLEGMNGESSRMQRLLDDLTHLYDQTMGPLELERRPTPLGAWLVQLLTPWREAAQEKGLRWEFSVPPDMPTLSVDPDRLAQVLENVIGNAVKYTPAGGTVSVEATSGEDGVAISVRDTGPGIALEEQPRIFTPFYRGSVGRRFPQGMGLGLSISRDLISAHGGSIDIESEPGSGSTFTIRLPLAP